MIRTVFLIIVIINTTILKAQDVHYSQFFSSSFLTNPSLLSFQENDYKATLHHRSQWQAIQEPFRTFTASLERKNILKNQSIGVQFLQDEAGDSDFKTTGASFSYVYTVDYNKNIIFSLACNTGFFQRSISYENLIFNQNEIYEKENFWFPDINFGFSNKFIFTSKTNIITGFSHYHINRPKQSLTGNENLRLNKKSNFHACLNSSLTKNILISTCFYHSSQKELKETVFGSNFKYSFFTNKEKTFGAGLHYRFKDAIICNVNANIGRFRFIISHDINVSSFKEATNSNGALEFVLQYKWNKKKRIEKTPKKETECPKYL
tara:strand:- start:1301 stop:2260 length:960 start_codon:yes stop_codon:yes gene_type:complete